MDFIAEKKVSLNLDGYRSVINQTFFDIFKKHKNGWTREDKIKAFWWSLRYKCFQNICQSYMSKIIIVFKKI